MRKILFVNMSLDYGGAERSMINLLHELPKDKYEIDVLLFQPKGDLLKLIPEYVHVLETPVALKKLYSTLRGSGKYMPVKLIGTGLSHMMKKGQKPRRMYRWSHFYKRCIKQLPGRYDLAIAYVSGEVLFYVGDKVCADKKMVWVHNDYRAAQYSKNADRPYFADMEAIVSVSKECVDVLKEEFPEFESKIFCLENITSSASVRQQALEFEVEEYKGLECTILSVGRLSPQKGFDLAIDAAALLRQNGLNFHWFIIGEGDLRAQLTQQIYERSVDDCFSLIGTRANPYPYIKNCTVLVQPSRYEGKSVVLDEAKILGTPIVATAYPTVSDQIKDGKEGVVTPMTPEGIAAGILRVIRNNDLKNEIKQYLFTHEYGNQTEVDKYMKLMDDSAEMENI